MKKYVKELTLSPSYFDLNDNIKLQSVLTIFQDIACEHGELIGIGYKATLSKGLYWITTRIKFDIVKSPKMYDKVICETWTHKMGRVDFDRDYLIHDEKGNILIKGTSKWCVISTVTRKLVLPSAENFPVDECLDEFVYPDKFTKTPFVTRKEQADFKHRVAYHEIDHNKHLNNVNYANYVFDAIKKDNIKFCQINFIAECMLDDKIEVFKEEKDGQILISGYVGDVIKFSALVK